MRVVAGTWRGRTLVAPSGPHTRPTADRVRQALFDMLLHAPWGGRQAVEGARVLDVFAGTGALGLEALSRGAAFATFIESDRTAVAALRTNITRCGATDCCDVRAVDVLNIAKGQPCNLLFLDPPYGQGLLTKAVQHLRAMQWIEPDALLIAESGRDEALPELGTLLDQRVHGAARISVWRG